MSRKWVPGARFGRLTIIKKIAKEGEKRSRMWLFKCDCGRYVKKSYRSVYRQCVPMCDACSGTGKRYIDITGKKFGHLLVLKRVRVKKSPAYWLCRCDCGKEVVKRGTHLRGGSVRSCGCLASVLKKGTKIFNLTLIESYTDWTGKDVVWKCVCDCGATVYVEKHLLRATMLQIRSVAYGMNRSIGVDAHVSRVMAECLVLIRNINKTVRSEKR